MQQTSHLEENVITFDSFLQIYSPVPSTSRDKIQYSTLKSFADLCQGWKHETFQQLVTLMTKKGQSPLPLVFTSVKHLKELSNKVEPLTNIFNHMNYRKLDRIDAMELISCILLAINGSFESFMKNAVFIFGFSSLAKHQSGKDDQLTINMFEFNFFLDSLLRGIMTLVAPPKVITD